MKALIVVLWIKLSNSLGWVIVAKMLSLVVGGGGSNFVFKYKKRIIFRAFLGWFLWKFVQRQQLDNPYYLSFEELRVETEFLWLNLKLLPILSINFIIKIISNIFSALLAFYSSRYRQKLYIQLYNLSYYSNLRGVIISTYKYPIGNV